MAATTTCFITEADIRRERVTPKLDAAGWGGEPHVIGVAHAVLTGSLEPSAQENIEWVWVLTKSLEDLGPMPAVPEGMRPESSSPDAASGCAAECSRHASPSADHDTRCGGSCAPRSARRPRPPHRPSTSASIGRWARKLGISRSSSASVPF